MSIIGTAAAAAEEIARTLEQVDEKQVEQLIDEICKARKIYVSAAGRSLLMMRGLAMRLMHLGFTSYVVGDTTTPAFAAGDLLIGGSGSGETSGLVRTVEKAKKLGGRIAILTISGESTLGQLADVCVEIPAFTAKREIEGMQKSILPSGSLFEESMLVLADTLIIPLAERQGFVFDGEFPLHANLE